MFKSYVDADLRHQVLRTVDRTPPHSAQTRPSRSLRMQYSNAAGWRWGINSNRFGHVDSRTRQCLERASTGRRLSLTLAVFRRTHERALHRDGVSTRISASMYTNVSQNFDPTILLQSMETEEICPTATWKVDFSSFSRNVPCPWRNTIPSQGCLSIDAKHITVAVHPIET